MEDKTLDTPVSQCPDRIETKLNLHRNKKFSSEIPNLFLFQNPTVRAWNQP